MALKMRVGSLPPPFVFDPLIVLLNISLFFDKTSYSLNDDKKFVA